MVTINLPGTVATYLFDGDLTIVHPDLDGPAREWRHTLNTTSPRQTGRGRTFQLHLTDEAARDLAAEVWARADIERMCKPADRYADPAVLRRIAARIDLIVPLPAAPAPELTPEPTPVDRAADPVVADQVAGYRTHILRNHPNQTLIDTYWYIVRYQLGTVIDEPALEGNPLVELILDPLLANFTDDSLDLVIDFTRAIVLELEARGYTECTGCATYGNRHLNDCQAAA